MLLGLRSHILHVDDLAATKAWYTEVLGHPPYFDEPFYVGFDVGGFELGLLPNRTDVDPVGGRAYWGVADIEAARQRLLDGGSEVTEVHDVGEGILMAVVTDPAGNEVGLIENPLFGT